MDVQLNSATIILHYIRYKLLYAHPQYYKNPELQVVSSMNQIVPSKKHKIKEDKRSSPQGRNCKYICRICFRAFDYKHVLINYARTHTGKKLFEYRMCNKKFTRNHYLKTHMRMLHFTKKRRILIHENRFHIR